MVDLRRFTVAASKSDNGLDLFDRQEHAIKASFEVGSGSDLLAALFLVFFPPLSLNYTPAPFGVQSMEFVCDRRWWAGGLPFFDARNSKAVEELHLVTGWQHSNPSHNDELVQIHFPWNRRFLEDPPAPVGMSPLLALHTKKYVEALPSCMLLCW